ncbi:hypothetical protein SSX86_007888 [Deinandra increscens subsp. villosa]|uniref:Uncharacterized protein n=1 Tax=Deinandra increscens subsp. villosa TaxID=3103831 RepID=A0AAP0DEQ2_9ASTR
MEFNGIKSITHEEEDRETLIFNKQSSDGGGGGGYYGGGVATVKVVEYMLSSMSIELLCKFPDNSAFDFDYTQSSIWSPLVPHPSNPSSPAPEIQRRLSYDEEEDDEGEQGGVKRTITDSCMFNCFRIHHKFSKKKMMAMKRRRSSFRGFGQLGPILSSNSVNLIADSSCSSPIQNKGWKKVLKAASKRFKKTMKKKESGAHLKLSSHGFSRIYY